MVSESTVVYCIVGKEHSSRVFESWHDATNLVQELIDSKALDKSEIRVSWCRSGWHQDLLMRICKGTQIENLEFASTKNFWGLIYEKQLEAVKESLERVLELFSSSIPNLGEWENDSVEDPRKHLSAFEQADIDFEIDSSSWGLEANRNFCSYIKTLHSTVSGALEKEKCLLYFNYTS